MTLLELNLPYYLNGFIQCSINNKIYHSKGNLVGFELKQPNEELYMFIELDNNNNFIPDQYLYINFIQINNNVTVDLFGVICTITSKNRDSIILTDGISEHFISHAKF